MVVFILNENVTNFNRKWSTHDIMVTAILSIVLGLLNIPLTYLGSYLIAFPIVFPIMMGIGFFPLILVAYLIRKPGSPYTRAAIQTEMDRQARERRATRQQQNTGPSAAEVRAWHARERKIQAEIARYRATPFYGAIAFDFKTNSLGWSGGYYAEQRAIESAIKNCLSANCNVVKVFNNACGVLVVE